MQHQRLTEAFKTAFREVFADMGIMPDDDNTEGDPTGNSPMRFEHAPGSDVAFASVWIYSPDGESMGYHAGFWGVHRPRRGDGVIEIHHNEMGFIYTYFASTGDLVLIP